GEPARTESEGSVSLAQIIVGPFDIHRKYRSMEGPYVVQKLRLSDLVDSKQVTIPEERVKFVEANPQGAPSMGGPSMNVTVADGTTPPAPLGLTQARQQKRELYWFKGMKLEVLDENDKPLPSAEFICHLNVDVDQEFRKQKFPYAEPCINFRLITLTQG